MTGSTPAPGTSIAVASLPNLRELGGCRHRAALRDALIGK